MRAFSEPASDWDWEYRMTDEQKFVFNLKGWLLFPSVLTEEEIAPIREHVLALKEPNLPGYPPGRWQMPSQALLDHPIVGGVLRELPQTGRRAVPASAARARTPGCTRPATRAWIPTAAPTSVRWPTTPATAASTAARPASPGS